MAVDITNQELPVYFDYCGIPDDYLVILRQHVTQLYICDIGYIRGCSSSDGCSDGYHIAGVCEQKDISVAQHYDTKETAAASLFELWRK